MYRGCARELHLDGGWSTRISRHGMSRPSKLVLLLAGGLAGLLLLAAAVMALVVRANATPRLEAAASAALEMEIKVEGRASVGLLPDLRVSLGDVRARKHGAEIASAGEIDVGIRLLPLLRGQVQVKSVSARRVRIAIERDRDGKLNVARSSRAAGDRTALNIDRLSVSDATLHYSNRQSGRDLDVADCSLDASRLQFSPVADPDAPGKFSLSGRLACGRMRVDRVAMSDVQLLVDGKDGALEIEPVTMRLFGGMGSGKIHADLTGPVPVYAIRYNLAQFRIDDFLAFLSPKDTKRKSVGDAVMDFSANLTMRGRSWDELTPSASGEASLHGENLKLEIGDLDHKFSRYESSQSFNLVDVGAFFFAGPLALGVTKGYDFARVFEGGGGSTTIRVLVSDWRVEDGVAHATDVAMATPKHRIALKGALDFVNGRFDEVTVALIDAEGCARARQKIRGPFGKPEVEKPDVLSAVSGPARKLLRQAKDLFGGQCEVFYAGSVGASG